MHYGRGGLMVVSIAVRLFLLRKTSIIWYILNVAALGIAIEKKFYWIVTLVKKKKMKTDQYPRDSTKYIPTTPLIVQLLWVTYRFRLHHKIRISTHVEILKLLKPSGNCRLVRVLRSDAVPVWDVVVQYLEMMWVA